MSNLFKRMTTKRDDSVHSSLHEIDKLADDENTTDFSYVNLSYPEDDVETPPVETIPDVTFDEQTKKNFEPDIELNRLESNRLESNASSDQFNVLNDISDTEQSPYEEVAAVVPNSDDTTLPCLTFRTWFLGLGFTCLLSFINQFFWYRTNPLTIGVLVVQLLSHPVGKLMARILPKKSVKVWKWNLTLNPGPFSIKEHTLITAMANAAWVGIMRRFLVWPSAMIWPSNLVSCALFRTLHETADEKEKEKPSKWKMSRLKFFFIAFGCQFLYYWFPGYIFPLLAAFSWICMIKPKNIVVAQLTGNSGLGIGSIDFDWNAIVAFLSSPIVVPFWAQLNILVGFVTLAWIFTPISYYLNLWGSQALPIVSNKIFTPDGYVYDIHAVLNKETRLNETAYEQYGHIRMTAIFAMSYGVSFAAITAVIVHTILYHGPQIIKQFKTSLSDQSDIHAKLMARYPEAPEWWYSILFVVSFIIAAIVCHVGKLMPWYYLFVAVAISFFFLLPTGIVQAITNQSIGLNVITEFVAGVCMKGNPLGNVTFKTYGYITQYQALL
ncbi:unnamed protein product, partial [Didymodactylos carnosus]